MPIADGAAADEDDSKWLSAFIGNSIPEGSTVEGFVAVISFMDPDGEMKWRPYSTIENNIRAIGLLTAAATTLTLTMTDEEP